MESTPEGPNIYMEVIINYGFNVITILKDFKEKTKKEIQRLTTMNVQNVTILAKGINMPEKLEEKKEEQ